MSEVNEASCSTCGNPQSIEHKSHYTIKYRNAAISLAALVAGLILNFLATDIVWIYSAFLISIFAAGRFIIPKGLRALIRRRLDQHFLMTSAAFGAIIIGAPAEGAAVMFLFYISTLLEERAEDKVRDEIQALVKLEPPTVTIKVDGKEACIAPEAVDIGDILIVKPGGKIGLDGIISSGRTSVDQSTITGESMPISKSIGDQVYAGTINNEGYIEVIVTETSKSSVLSRIIQLVDESRKSRAPIEKTISRFSRVYTPIVVVLSLFVAFLSFMQGLSLTDSVYRGLTLLVVSCPCAFAVSIPVSLVSAITGAARDGVLVKGGIHIERMSNVSIIAFDKTGTLTEGVLSVKDVCLHNNHTKDEILGIAASIESMSEHPIAKALVDAISPENSEKAQASNLVSLPGRGVRGFIGNTEFIVGNRRLLVDESISLEPTDQHICGAGTMVYVAQESEHFGTIILSDTLRPGTKEAISTLKKMGIHTVMLTGDSKNVAHEIADELGIDEYRAELLPEQKVRVINEMKQFGTTIMIGDGINDAPALAAADVGIAMGVAGSDAALETADVALMIEDLRKVPRLIAKAKKTMRIVRQNIATSLSIKAITGVLASVGLMTLWLAIGMGDMGLTFLVIANALRLARKG